MNENWGFIVLIRNGCRSWSCNDEHPVTFPKSCTVNDHSNVNSKFNHPIVTVCLTCPTTFTTVCSSGGASSRLCWLNNKDF